MRSGKPAGSDAMARLGVQFAIAIQCSATDRQGRDQVSGEFFMRQAEKAAGEGVVVQRGEPKTRTDPTLPQPLRLTHRGPPIPEEVCQPLARTDCFLDP